MVAPITGPFVTTVSLKGPPTGLGFKPTHFSLTRRSWRQRKPYNLPLQFQLDKRYIETYRSNDSTTYKETSALPSSLDSTSHNDAYAKCYERFKQAVKGDTSEMAVSLAERRQALDMISKRSIQLWRFTRAVRKFRFGDALEELGLARDDSRLDRRKLKKNAKSFGNNWLEFWFGWKPLIGDIGNSVDLLQRGLPPFRVRARAAEGRAFTVLSGSGFSARRDDHQVKAKWQIGAEIEVSNPNLLLANQLGFVNPATIAWELVPFSFVLDWFVNVSDFLGSFTEFWGLTLIRPYRTYVHERWTKGVYTVHPSRETWTGRCIFSERLPGPIPGPALRLRPPWRLSPTRALTSVSLLLQRLK